MGYIELEAFSVRDGVTREAFLALDAELQEWTYLHREGVLRRTTAFEPDGSVLVLTMFAGRTPPAPADPTAPAIGAFTGAVDPLTYRTRTYTDLG